jgi:hypothetical protein
MENIKDALEADAARMTAKFGPEFLAGVDALIPKFEKMMKAFIGMGDKLPVFQTLSMIFEGWGEIFDGIGETVTLLNSYVDKISTKGFGEVTKASTANPALGFSKEDEDLANDLKEGWHWLSGVLANGALPASTGGSKSSAPPQYNGADVDVRRDFKNGWNMLKDAAMSGALPASVASPAPHVPVSAAGPQGANTRPIEVNQTLQFNHSGTNAQQTASDVKVATRQAFRSLPSTGIGA